MHQTINGNAETIAIARAINELRCGRAVFSAAATHPGVLWASAETLSPELLQRLTLLAGEDGLTLFITGQRAQALGLIPQTDGEAAAYQLRLGREVQPQVLALLAGIGPADQVEAAQSVTAG